MTRVALLAPSPILTVTVEREAAEPELHIHAGGQGFWVARMLRSLGVAVSFCAPLGGEVGTVLRPVLEAEGLELCTVGSGGSNGAYVHDRRRGGDPVTVAETASPPLTRHETDALYATTLSAALDASLTVLTGPRSEQVIDPDFYRRLTGDLRRNGRTVVADLSGRPLAAALAGGIDILHLSVRELSEHAGDPPGDPTALIAAMQRYAIRVRATWSSHAAPSPPYAVGGPTAGAVGAGVRDPGGTGGRRFDARGDRGVGRPRAPTRRGAAHGRCRRRPQRGAARPGQRQQGGHRAPGRGFHAAPGLGHIRS